MADREHSRTHTISSNVIRRTCKSGLLAALLSSHRTQWYTKPPWNEALTRRVTSSAESRLPLVTLVFLKGGKIKNCHSTLWANLSATLQFESRPNAGTQTLCSADAARSPFYVLLLRGSPTATDTARHVPGEVVGSDWPLPGPDSMVVVVIPTWLLTNQVMSGNVMLFCISGKDGRLAKFHDPGPQGLLQ